MNTNNYNYTAWKNPDESSDYGNPPIRTKGRGDVSGLTIHEPGGFCPNCLKAGLHHWIVNFKGCDECKKRKANLKTAKRKGDICF